MIKLQSLHIKDFRGIRNLELKFNGKNYAISGPNGTGKSGVVDAIDFALTGKISRLSGEGTGDVSVNAHGSHVDCPIDDAEVTLVMDMPTLGKKVTLNRKLKTPGKPIITPNDADVTDKLCIIAGRSEFVLSRRQLMQFILVAPNDRALRVQTLLKLDEVGKIRKTIGKIANAQEKEKKTLARVRDETRDAALRALQITQFTQTAVLAAVNPRRETLGLAPLVELKPETSIKDGLETGVARQARIVKTVATADVQAAENLLNQYKGEEFKFSCAKAMEAIGKLKDVTGKTDAGEENLLQAALKQFDGEQCPVCETDWDPEEFQTIIYKKVAALRQATINRQEAQTAVSVVTTTLQQLNVVLSEIEKNASKLKIDAEPLSLWRERLSKALKSASQLFPVDEASTALAELATPDETAVQVVTAFKIAIDAIPDTSKEDAARDYLVAGHERIDAYRQAARNYSIAETKATKAREVSDAYNRSADEELERVYEKVNVDFVELYRALNPDEDTFTASLKPSDSGLDFKVNFFGRGEHPPAAYHSEGHQDSMGLCLYLSLMRYLHGEDFTFAVLDDVVMSVDADHRGRLAEMLKQAFPKTQFVITTHDKVWETRMVREDLVAPENVLKFRTWTVDDGPVDWDTKTIWDEIEADLRANKVESAAGTLRRYSEHFFAEACDDIRAPVEMSLDSKYTVGDVMPRAVAKLKKILKAARKAAESWGQTARVTKIDEITARLAAADAVVRTEEWQSNAKVHFNSWANLSATEFRKLYDAVKEVVSCFFCSNCSTPVKVQPYRGAANGFHCTCRDLDFTLASRPKADQKAA